MVLAFAAIVDNSPEKSRYDAKCGEIVPFGLHLAENCPSLAQKVELHP